MPIPGAGGKYADHNRYRAYGITPPPLTYCV